MPSLATPRPLLSLGAPPQNNLFLGALPHQDPLSQPPPPTRVGAGAPTGGWGAVGPPVGWASGQHGGGVCGEKSAACPGPAGPASPAAGRTSGTGGSVGDNSSRRPAKGGERRGRGSARGTRGKGKAGGRGRGGLTLAPPAPPSSATRPRGPQRPASHPGGPPGPAEPRRAGPDRVWQSTPTMATTLPLATAAKSSTNYSPGQLLLGDEDAAGGAETKQRAGARPGNPLPVSLPRLLLRGSAPSRNPTKNSQARPAPAHRPPPLLPRPHAKSRGDAGRAGPVLPPSRERVLPRP